MPVGELIVFADAEQVVIDVLAAGGLTAFQRVPNPRPDSSPWLLVQRVGGVRLTLVSDEPTLVVHAWAPTTAAASDLCQQARAVLHANATAGGVFYRVVEIAGPSFNPDPESDIPRHSMTVAVHLRASNV